MTKQRIYKKSKISRVVEKAQWSITEKHNSYAWVSFGEWYMTIRDGQLVVNIPYIVTPMKKFKHSSKTFSSVHFETV